MTLLVASTFAAATVVACVGWGRCVEQVVGGWGAAPLPRLSTGTAGCIGLAAFLCGAGAFVAIDQYRPWMGWLWVAAGCSLAVHATAKGRSSIAWNRPVAFGTLAAVVVLAMQALYQTGSALGVYHFNPCDDLPAYLTQIHRLTETGGIIEPFSLRRAGGLGGVSLFDSLFTATLGLKAAYVADFVAGGLLVGLLLMPLSTRNPRLLLGALLVLSFTLWQSLRVNLSPTYLPVAMIAAAILVVVESGVSRDDPLDRRILILIGLLCAGLLTFRVPVALPVGLFGLMLIARAKGAAVGERLRAVAVLGLAIGLPVVPWMIALWRSSGTPLYPPISGNVDTSWPGFTAPGVDLVAKLGHVLGTGEVAWMLGAIVIAVIALIILRRSTVWAEALLWALFSVAITFAIMLFSLSAGPSGHLARYAWPLIAGVLVATLAMLANEATDSQFRAGRSAAALIAVTIAFVLAAPTDRLRGEVGDSLDGVKSTFTEGALPLPGGPSRQDYVAVERSLPPGAKVATTSDYPYFFDYDRNDFEGLDMLGAVSPPPGMPLPGSLDAMTEYLRQRGFDFVVATDPRQSLCLYNAETWRRYRIHGPRLFASMAPPFLEWFSWLSERERELPRQSTRHGSLIVLDLRRGT